MDKKQIADKLLKAAGQKKKEGDLEGALELNEELIKLFPKVTIFWTFRGEYLFLMKRYSEALECTAKALELKPRNSFALTVLGLINRNLGNYIEAAEAFTKSIKIKEDFSNYTLLASVQLKFDPKAAIQSAQKALELNPDWEEAKVILQKAKSLSP